MTQVAITGLTRIDRPKPNQGGSSILAWFDCEVVGFALKGCALVRTAKNGLVAWPPKLDSPEGQRRSIAIKDDAIRHAMMINARAVYQALGGTDADWVGRCIPEGPERPPMGTNPRSGDGKVCVPVTRTHVRPDRDPDHVAEQSFETDDTPESEGVLRFLGVSPEREEAAQ
jgi:hypothetical protein